MIQHHRVGYDLTGHEVHHCVGISLIICPLMKFLINSLSVGAIVSNFMPIPGSLNLPEPTVTQRSTTALILTGIEWIRIVTLRTDQSGRGPMRRAKLFCRLGICISDPLVMCSVTQTSRFFSVAWQNRIHYRPSLRPCQCYAAPLRAPSSGIGECGCFTIDY